MIVKDITIGIDCTGTIRATLFLNGINTGRSIKINIDQLAKINIGDDITIIGNKIKVLTKNNNNKYLLPKVCPSCGYPLNQRGKDLVCNNLYGCAPQRVDLLRKWLIHFSISASWAEIFLNYFNLGNNFIFNKLQKDSIETVVPMLYVFSEKELLIWAKDRKLVDKFVDSREQIKHRLKLADIFRILPNNFTQKQCTSLCKKYKTIKRFLQLSEMDLQDLKEIFGKDSKKTMELITFISQHTPMLKQLEILGVSLTNK